MRVHVFYIGRVQGVGFRFTVQRLAHQWKVSGWVRNLFDGRVELWAEGPLTALIGLQADIDREFQGYITSQKKAVDDEPAQYTNFCIK